MRVLSVKSNSEASPSRRFTHWREILREGLQPETAEPAIEFEALAQAGEQLAVELEGPTGHKAVQHVKIRRVAARR
jgi:hypothetical protein